MWGAWVESGKDGEAAKAVLFCCLEIWPKAGLSSSPLSWKAGLALPSVPFPNPVLVKWQKQVGAVR